MPITANVTNEQITASVGETQIDVTVSGGIGPSGPVGGGYVLPIATAGTLGGVKIGSGISIDGDGVISASAGYTLPTATNSVLGGVKIGSGVTITDGVISVSTNYAAASHTHTFTESSTTSTYTNFLTTVGGGTLADALAGIDSSLTGKAAAAGGDAYAPTAIVDDALGLWDYVNDQPWLTGIDGSVYLAAGYDTALRTAIGAAALSHAHSASDVTSGTFDIARIPTGTSSTTVCIGNDARLSDARTPTAHNHAASDINSGTLDIARIPTGTSSTTVCIGNDARLSDARTPTAHNQAWSTITSTPTTRSGYGITDAQKTITSGTAAPTGGSDGDIYLQY